MPVAAAFHGLRDRVLKRNDALFGERVRLVFMADGEPDGTRESIEVTGVLRSQRGRTTRVPDGKVLVAGQKTTLSLDPAAYSGPPLRKGDKVRALARPGEPWFEVLHVDDRSHTRIVAELGEA